MPLLRFLKKLFCRCKGVHPFTVLDLPEEERLYEAQIEKFEAKPYHQFTCPKCEIVPEIMEMHSDTGNLFIYCNKHQEFHCSTTEYLAFLKDSNFTYLKLKCSLCKANPSGRKTQMQYCVKCREPICKKCIELTHQEHLAFLIPICAINNTCRKHKNEKAELYCKDCEEIICEDDMIHSDHRVVDTYDLKKEVNKYREKIIKKNQKLFSMLEFYKLVLLKGNEDVKKTISESIQKEKDRDEYDVDLAIYYLKKIGKKEIIDIESS
jgi:hypothetical protein